MARPIKEFRVAPEPTDTQLQYYGGTRDMDFNRYRYGDDYSVEWEYDPAIRNDTTEKLAQEHRAKGWCLHPSEQFQRGEKNDRNEAIHALANWAIEKYSLRSHESGRMYRYDDASGLYVADGEERVQLFAEKEMGPDCTNKMMAEVIGKIRRTTYTEDAEFDSSPNLLVVGNGVLDLDEKAPVLRSWNPDYLIRSGIPTHYDPDAECPEIISFVSELVHAEDLPIVQELAGYLLYKKHFVKKAFMLLGETNTGKSRFIELLVRFVGVRNTSSVSLQALNADRFAVVQLLGKMMNTDPEISDARLALSGNFKASTGGDQLFGQFKGKDGFGFVSFAKQIYGANRLPKSRDDSLAFYGRWIVLPFDRSFTSDPDMDPFILERVCTDSELSGFLNWALAGLRRLRAAGQFSCGMSPQELKDLWLDRADDVRGFVNDRLVVDQAASIAKDRLQAMYTEYCLTEGLPPQTPHYLTAHLKRCVPVTLSHRGRRGKRYWAWLGIGEKDADEPVASDPPSLEDFSAGVDSAGDTDDFDFDDAWSAIAWD